MVLVKIWSENWHLQLVFVGHCAPISSLSFFPYGPMFISASEDKTIRVWNLETCDQVERFISYHWIDTTLYPNLLFKLIYYLNKINIYCFIIT